MTSGPLPRASLSISAVRRGRFIYAVSTSSASKLAALLVQLIAFPFALRAFGTERYASFLALQSLLSWTGLCGLGLSLSLPNFIASASVAGEHDRERNLVLTAIILLGCASIILTVLLVSLGMAVSPAEMVASGKGVSADELRAAYLVAACISAAQLFSSIEASIRSGYQEFHRASWCAIIASVFFVLPGLFFVGRYGISISGFLLIMYAPLVFVFLVDLALLFFQRPYLRSGPAEFWETAKKIASPSGNALAYQVEYALIVYLPTLVVAHLCSPSQTASFGSVMQIMALGGSSLNLLFQPFMSAAANAHSHGDHNWMERNYKRFLLLIASLGGCIFLVAATVGPILIHQWLGKSIIVSRSLMMGFGGYFFVLSTSIFQFYVLSAMGALSGTGWIYLFQGCVAIVLGSILCMQLGAIGMIVGLTIGVAVTWWLLPVRVLRAIKRL